jgi:hypothetical protein
MGGRHSQYRYQPLINEPEYTYDILEPEQQQDTAHNINKNNNVKLPVDVFTCILEYLVDMSFSSSTNHDTRDFVSMASFRLISKATKQAFDNLKGWNLVYQSHQHKVQVLSNKIGILTSTIADPPSLNCILKLDAYLTQCWSLKQELSLQRSMLQQDVMTHIAQLGGVQEECENDHCYHDKNSVVLISEWHGDECMLTFQPIENEELRGFSLPAIDSSELPFLLA